MPASAASRQFESEEAKEHAARHTSTSIPSESPGSLVAALLPRSRPSPLAKEKDRVALAWGAIDIDD